MADFFLIVIGVFIALGSFPLTIFLTTKLCAIHGIYFFLPFFHAALIIYLVYSFITQKSNTGDATPGVLFAWIYGFLIVHIVFAIISLLLYFLGKHDITIVPLVKWVSICIIVVMLTSILISVFHDFIFKNFFLKKNDVITAFSNQKKKALYFGKYSVQIPIDFISNQFFIYPFRIDDVEFSEATSSQLEEFKKENIKYHPHIISEESETINNGILKTEVFAKNKNCHKFDRVAIYGVFESEKLSLKFRTGIDTRPGDLSEIHNKFKAIVVNLHTENNLNSNEEKSFFYLPDGDSIDISNFKNTTNMESDIFYICGTKNQPRINLRASMHRTGYRTEDIVSYPIIILGIWKIIQKWAYWLDSKNSYSIHNNHLIRLRSKTIDNFKGTEVVYGFDADREFSWQGYDIKNNRTLTLKMSLFPESDISWSEGIHIWDSMLKSIKSYR